MILKTYFLHLIGCFRRDLKPGSKLFIKIPLKSRPVMPMNGEWDAVVAGLAGVNRRWRTRPGQKQPCVIMSRLEQLRVTGQMILLAIAGAAMVAPCTEIVSGGYLAVVGPPNLRFASASAHENFTPTRFFPIETNAAKTELSSAANLAAATNNFPIPTNAAPITSVVMQADSTPPPASSPALTFAPSSTDPSIVTPAMLVDYLKPSATGKSVRGNNDSNPALVVPVNPGFTPPTAVPQNTSRAVYQNE
jgi:hypothetical protein